MKFIKPTIFVLFLLVFTTSVFAPATVITNDAGFQIETTAFDYMYLNQNFTANFHVFNITNGMLMNNQSIICNLHVYDHYGSHIFEYYKLPYSTSDGEWEVFLSNANFSVIGYYSWVVYCNSTDTGGFRSSIFEIVNPGYEDNIAMANYTYLFMGVLGIIFLIISLFVYILGLKRLEK